MGNNSERTRRHGLILKDVESRLSDRTNATGDEALMAACSRDNDAEDIKSMLQWFGYRVEDFRRAEDLDGALEIVRDALPRYAEIPAPLRRQGDLTE